MSKAKQINETRISFLCQGCKGTHWVKASPANDIEGRWEFNGDYDKPTFSPSVLSVKGNGDYVTDENGKHIKTENGGYKWREFPKCHLFIKDGMIQFLNDCEHEFAGQTLEMEDI